MAKDSKRIVDYIAEKKETRKSLFQVKVKESLLNQAMRQMEKDGISRTDFLEAALKRYLDESK